MCVRIVTDGALRLVVDFNVNYHSCSHTSSTSSSSSSPAAAAAAAAAAVNVSSAVTTTAAVVVTSAVGGGATSTLAGGRGVSAECHRESSLLFLLLVLGTVWLGLSLYNFTKTLVQSPRRTDTERSITRVRVFSFNVPHSLGLPPNSDLRRISGY